MKVDRLKKAWDKAPKCVKKEKMGSEKKSANEASDFFWCHASLYPCSCPWLGLAAIDSIFLQKSKRLVQFWLSLKDKKQFVNYNK